MIKINNHEKTGILPVINIPNASLAVPLAEALRRGGVNSIEVTLRSADSLDSIKNIKTAFPDMTVGAGTVLTTLQADKAIENGADFIVSPGYDEEVVAHCIEKGIRIVPGCTTPSEIQKAVKKGLKVLKFFPAELSGGIDAINLLSGPFPEVQFVPTGGITFENLGTYLKSKKVLASGGSFMASKAQIINGEWDKITAACKKAVDISLGFSLAHVGINCQGEESACAVAEKIAEIFKMEKRDLGTAVFAGTYVEAVKENGWGEKGHIGFFTNSIPRALAYFESMGIALNEEGFKYNKNGEVNCVYLKENVGGFALHVVER